MSKHFTTNGRVSDYRAQSTERIANHNRIRAERQRLEQEKRNLLALQRKFDLRAGRVR